MIRVITNNIPEFCMSHWLIRIPLIVVFLQQGFDKWPINAETAAAYELTLLVWAFVVLGEIGSGFGLIAGGLLDYTKGIFKELGDLITRFSGITITGIMTGVIWLSEPASFSDVILYDNFHVLLWVGGMYFALRGNRT
jgi:putative oxidoreductase